MTRVLITGFEPFGAVTENPSQAGVLGAAPRLAAAGLDVVTEILPVEFGVAAGRLRELLAEQRPDVAICFGVAEGRDAVTPERVAINIADARIPDNGGRKPVDEPLDAAGPAAHFSTLPLREIVAALEASGVAARISNTAGTYVCNSVFYALMSVLEAGAARGGFVHIPPGLADPAAVVETVVRTAAESAASAPARRDG